MKTKKENYVTKTEFKSAMTYIDKRFTKSETKLIGMMGTMENRLNNRIDQLDLKFTAAMHDQRIETRELINNLGEMMIARFDRLGEIFVTRQEFLAHKCQ